MIDNKKIMAKLIPSVIIYGAFLIVSLIVKKVHAALIFGGLLGGTLASMFILFAKSQEGGKNV